MVTFAYSEHAIRSCLAKRNGQADKMEKKDQEWIWFLFRSHQLFAHSISTGSECSTARTKQLFTALVLWLLLELPISLSCTIIIWGLLASLHLYDKDVDQLLPARPFLSLSYRAGQLTLLCIWVCRYIQRMNSQSVIRTSAACWPKETKSYKPNTSHDPTLSELS